MMGNKYHAVRTEVDGITFHSKGEAKRYGDLKLLEKSNSISGLKLQPKYVLSEAAISPYHGKLRPISYVGDFSYRVIRHSVIAMLGQEAAVLIATKDPDYLSVEVCEDFKGHRTPVYKLKRHLFVRRYPDIYHLETSI